MNALLTAGRRRLGRVQSEKDGGFALIFVLFVTTVIMIGTASMLTVTVGGIKPARQNQDTATALAAAQSGVQAYLATLNANCKVGSITQCVWLQNQGTAALTGAIGSERYSTRAANPGQYNSAGNNGTLRLVSRGTSPTGTADAVTRTLTVDVSGKPSPLALTYVSNYETLGTSFLNSYYDPRKITLLDGTIAGAVGLSAGTTVTWDGTAAARADALTDGLCDKLYYDDASNGADASGRATLKGTRTALPLGTDYAENGATAPLVGASSPVTRYAPCELTFTRGENFTGPVYSRDAFYLSNSDKQYTTGPKFAVPASESYPALSTGWRTAPDPNNPYRSFPLVGGVPAAGSGTLSASPFSNLALPSSTGITRGTCTFTGPTSISLSGTTATVTSPLTSSPGASCRATAGATGVFTVPVTRTTIYVGNATASASLGFLNLPGTDITNYSTMKGDAYVQGTLSSGRLSIVTANDIVVTGDLLTGHASRSATQTTTIDPANGERSWAAGTGAIDLVATNNVRVSHPVACKVGVATYGKSGSLVPTSDAPTGYCTNDISGLYTSAQANIVVQSNGDLKSTHPSLQYTNLSTGSATHEIDAAVFALNGSFYTDNFDRGTSLGDLLVSGGVYENHHGAVGEQWASPNSNTSNRANSGYKLQITYLNYTHAGLGYVPELSGGNVLQPWQVVSASSGGA